jgi:hypothetical protein
MKRECRNTHNTHLDTISEVIVKLLHHTVIVYNIKYRNRFQKIEFCAGVFS